VVLLPPEGERETATDMSGGAEEEALDTPPTAEAGRRKKKEQNKHNMCSGEARHNGTAKTASHHQTPRLHKFGCKGEKEDLRLKLV